MPGTSGKPLMVVQGRPSAGVGTHSTPSSLFPGDKTVSFKDFLGVLTDSHRLAQCLSEWQGWRGRRAPAWGSSSLPSPVLIPGQVRNSQGCGQQRLQTLFFEILFKLMRLGFVPYKSMQEIMRWAQLYVSSLRTQDKGRRLCLVWGSLDVPAADIGPHSSQARDKWLPVLLWLPACEVERAGGGRV